MGRADDEFVPWTAKSPGAQAFNRAAAILRTLAVFGTHGASVRQVAHATGLSASTVHRLLGALVDERFAERARGSRRYRLGMEVVALAAAAGTQHDMRRLARPALERIAARFGQPAHLLVQAGYDVVVLDQIVPDDRAALIGGIGARAPLGVSASGMALLAFLNDDQVADAMRQNARRLHGHPVFGVDRIREEIRLSRRRGYAMIEIKGATPHYGISVPVLDGARRPIAALGFTTADGLPLAADRAKAVTGLLRDEAARLGRAYEAQHESAAPEWISIGAAPIAEGDDDA